MPDHVHLLITVGSQITIERAVQFIKGGFAFRAGRECGIRPPIWQKRFSEIRVKDSVAFASSENTSAITLFLHFSPHGRRNILPRLPFPGMSWMHRPSG
jgi:hypothetical protein